MQYETHVFSVDVAEKLGVDAAIMINNFYFWIKKNKANNRNLRAGSYWTYNSVEAFCELFPYWTKGQIRRILTNLIKKNILKKDKHNINKFDSTLWYAFTDDFLKEMKWVELLAKSETETQTQTEIKTETQTETYKTDFEIFYEKYPSHKSKSAIVRKKWAALSKSQQEEVLDSLPDFENLIKNSSYYSGKNIVHYITKSTEYWKTDFKSMLENDKGIKTKAQNRINNYNPIDANDGFDIDKIIKERTLIIGADNEY